MTAGVLFESRAAGIEQFRDAGQVPVRISRLYVSKIGGKKGDGMIERDAVLMPLKNAVACKRMAIMPSSA